MSQSEYRLHYHGVDEVMESVRYTLADDDSQAVRHFKMIAPIDEGREWFFLEKFCPYADKWCLVEQYNMNTTTQHTHG